jgi:glycosyltransferase involved in cell wall biosynthesis
MRVLLLTLIAPFPPDSGPKVKTYNLLQYLAQRHDVTLVSLVRSEQERGAAEALRPLCEAVYTVPFRRSRLRDVFFFARSLLRGESFIMSRDASPELERLLAELTSRSHYDIIHADQLNMARFALGLPGGARVLDQHNAVWTIVQRMARTTRLLPKRIALELEARRIMRYEAEMCQAFDAVVAVSEPDRRALELAIEASGGDPGAMRCSVIPIAVDTAGERPVPRAQDSQMILSMATMFWPPNVDGVLWFAREVLPLVWREAPQARFVIAGARPPQQVRRLAENEPRIAVTGYVQNPRPMLEASAALIVPVRAGGGMRVKILEALARGVPIVSTTVGFEGIALTPGHHLLVADTPDAFAAALLELLRNPELGRRLAAASRQLAEQSYDWRVVNAQVDAVYEACLGAPAQ